MKKTTTLSVFLLTLMWSVVSFAQDTVATSSTRTTSTYTTEETWYLQPWAWVVGGILLLILLISLFRSRSGRADSVTYTKTVRRDDEI